MRGGELDDLGESWNFLRVLIICRRCGYFVLGSAQIFLDIWKNPSNSRRQNVDMRPVPYVGRTIISLTLQNLVVTASRHPGCVHVRFRLCAIERGGGYDVMKWEGCARKWSWPNLRSAAVLYLPEGTEMKQENPSSSSPVHQLSVSCPLSSIPLLRL